MTIDRLNPTVAVNIVDGSLNDGDTSSQVTFTFSEAPVGFTAADITAVGGTVTGLTATADPLVYTATFTATDGFSGTGSVGDGGRLHRRGRQCRRGRLRHRDDRPAQPDGCGQHRRWLAHRRRCQLAGDIHLQRGAGWLHGRRHYGGGRHGDRPDRHGGPAGLHRDLHGDRRLLRHRLGGGAAQLHRRGRQCRRGRLRHGDDRPAQPGGCGQHRRWLAQRRRCAARR